MAYSEEVVKKAGEALLKAEREYIEAECLLERTEAQRVRLEQDRKDVIKLVGECSDRRSKARQTYANAVKGGGN